MTDLVLCRNRNIMINEFQRVAEQYKDFSRISSREREIFIEPNGQTLRFGIIADGNEHLGMRYGRVYIHDSVYMPDFIRYTGYAIREAEVINYYLNEWPIHLNGFER